MKRPRVVLQKHPSDMMLDISVCRNCGRPVMYGNLINNTGHDACPSCYEGLRNNIEHIRNNNYDLYRDSDHLYQMKEDDYQEAVRKLKVKYNG